MKFKQYYIESLKWFCDNSNKNRFNLCKLKSKRNVSFHQILFNVILYNKMLKINCAYDKKYILICFKR